MYCALAKADSEELQSLSCASSRIAALEVQAEEFVGAGPCVFFLPDVANAVDLKVWGTLSAFEQDVSSLISDHYFCGLWPAVARKRNVLN